MVVFILVLLLLAAIFGILGAVLKTVAFLVITALLTVVILGALGWWSMKRKAKSGFQAGGYRVKITKGDEPPSPGSRDDRY